MAKKLSLEQIESHVENLELLELLKLQKKLVTLIAKHEQENTVKLGEITRNLELIKNGGNK